MKYLRKRLLFGLMAIALLLSSCSNATPVQTAQPSATPAIPATATSLPSPTLEPTLTSTPKPSPTPRPTRVPEGYVQSTEVGFGITLASSWSLTHDGSDGFILQDSRDLLSLFAISQSEPEELTIAEFIDTVKTLLGDPDEFEEVTRGTGLLGADGFRANYIDFGDPKGAPGIIFRAYYRHNTGRGYYIFLIGTSAQIAARQDVMDLMLQSAQFFRPSPFDTPYSETLSLVGGDPQDQDLDPALTTGSASSFIGIIYSGLVELDSHMQVAPVLAETYELSSDGLVYTFHLHQGMTFSKGDPITAQSVKDSWERACDPATGSTTARTYLGDIVGVAEKLDGSADEISGVKVLDNSTLQVTIDSPKPYFLEKLTYPTAFVVNTRAIKSGGTDWMYHPDSSGPYTLDQYIEGTAILFKKNPNYVLPVKIENIAILIAISGAPLSLFEEGSIDVTSISSDDILRIQQEDDPLHADLQSVPSLCTDMLMLDISKPPLDDPYLRQALALSIDRDKLNESLAQNLQLTTTKILPPAMPGYSPQNGAPTYDPEAAKQALQKSAYAGKPPQIVISAVGYGDLKNQEIEMIAQMWSENLGIRVKVNYVNPQNGTEEIKADPGNVKSFGWCADYPDPQNFLDLLFRSDSDFNVAGYSNTGVDILLDQANTNQDPQTRIKEYQVVEQNILADGAVIPLTNSILYILVSPRVEGYQLTPLFAPNFAQIGLKAEDHP